VELEVKSTSLLTMLLYLWVGPAVAERLPLDVDLEVARDLPPEMALQWLRQTPKTLDWPFASELGFPVCEFTADSVITRNPRTDAATARPYAEFTALPQGGGLFSKWNRYELSTFDDRMHLPGRCQAYVGIVPRQGRGDSCMAYISPAASQFIQGRGFVAKDNDTSCEQLKLVVEKTLTALAALGVEVELEQAEKP
jgi:hypothetical protein